ncbi:MAG: succinate CoA transferase, partial [Paludibacteraceae bacterium]|nr:succinate CoA transferase [Paludibacteraceae bacterium]
MRYPILTPDEAAAFINHGDICGFSGFTAAGTPKAVPTAIAKKAEALHAEGKEFKISVFTGASSGDMMDGALARANAEAFRIPYQNVKDLRARINAHETHYTDMHLSMVAQEIRYGFLPRPKWAIVEACQVTDDGEIVPTLAVGILPTICRLADHIIIELNDTIPPEWRGVHDIVELKDPPYREAIPILNAADRFGSDCVKVDPKKIVGVVKTHYPTEVKKFTQVDEVTERIGQNVAAFLEEEMHAGRIPKEFLPIQSGVGNVANAMLGAMGNNPNIPPFYMYTEVAQDSVIGLIKEGHIKAASACALTCTAEKIDEVLADLDFFKKRLILRPSEISNNPEVARRLGVISINTALEADIFGNVNSTHVLGTKMMNGIGGSCDFTRSAYLSIFTTPATAKDGKISSIVPMVSHLDSSEHSIKIIATEFGVADLRGKSPIQRAEEIISKCAAPEYRDMLREYLKSGSAGHTPVNLNTCFNM